MVDETQVTYLTSPQAEDLPEEFQSRNLRKRALLALVALGLLVAVFLLAPGLGDVRDLLVKARPGWLVFALALEGLSFVSYLIMFGPIFCTGLTWNRSWQIGGAELAMGSIVPASGAGGLALGAWVLHRGGMGGERIARRSVAFFMIKSGVNFAAVALLGFVLAIGLLGPDLSLWLTALPAALAALSIGGVALLPRLGPGERAEPDAPRLTRWLSATRRALIDGTVEAGKILQRRHPAVIAGAIGYWAFDNLVLWATYHAFGASVPLTVVLMGYLIGQLGGALPLPGGIGGIDLGLIGTLIVYGAPAAATAAAVLAYRIILFWLPLVVGGIAFELLRRDMPSGQEFAACAPALAARSG
jgi:uncharacterized membrane protein YbhN (UPF0104 family)